MKNRQDRIHLNEILEEENIEEVRTIAIYLFGAYLDTLGRVRDLNGLLHSLQGKCERMTADAIEKEVYRIGKETYDEFATERKRLTILQTPRDVFSGEFRVFLLEHGVPPDLTIPVIQKNFQPFSSNDPNKLDEVGIREAAKRVAEVENKLLSVCKDGDKLFEEMALTCRVDVKDGGWVGVFRICLNSERTPTLADALRVTHSSNQTAIQGEE